MKKIIALMIATALSLYALDINTATKEELIKIKGIGTKKAERIIAYRNEHGKFQNLDELKNVKGIGKKLVKIIKESIEEEG